jgi:PIN domain nuclease of toxin-antitoxin system
VKPRYLLDTSTFLWWLADKPRLSKTALSLMVDGANEIVLSAASVWEIAIKIKLGKLALRGDLQKIIEAQVRTNGVQILAITAAHASLTLALPMIHRDPFDRLLIAQARAERLALLSSDEEIARYPVDVVW